MKKIFSLLLALGLLLAAVPALAEDADASSVKEEVVYGMLEADGTPTELEVVNIFTGGDLVDYGAYSMVKNLTGSEPITQNGEQITLHTDAARFYYQGTLTGKALPWLVAVTYTLDGQEITPAALAGASGALQIHLTVTQNPEGDATFYQNYALQVTVTLNPELCANIQAEGLTVAEAAGMKQLTYTALPGQGADFTLSADVHDFQMDAITLAGVRMNLNFALDSQAIQDQVTQLTDAIAKLDDGATDLKTGALSLSDGLAQYIAGVQSLADGVGQLSAGTGELVTGAASLQQGLTTLSTQSDALVTAAQTMQQATFDAVNQQLAAQKLGLPTLTPENYAQVLAGVDALADVKAQLDGAVQFTQGLTGYTAAVAQLSDGAASLSTGLGQVESTLAAMPDATATLTASGTQLQTGASDLSTGLASYQEGTAELRSQTEGLADSVTDQVASALGGLSGNGDAVKSFVSENNTRVTAVQFVLRTDPIAIVKTETAVEETAPEKTFLQRLGDLFGIGN